MFTVYPDFYFAFRCKADLCRHTCCAGWEICVDEASRGRYLRLPGPLGEKLRRNMTDADGETQFLLTSDRRCPFLQNDGLCELILTLGEDALCEICREHPRFYEERGEYELTGQGLSCEAAAELLLSEETPLSFMIDDGEAAAQCTFPDVCRVLGLPAPPETDTPFREAADRRLTGMQDTFLRLEALDPAWPGVLKAALEAPLSDGGLSGAAYERAYTYILYRQLEYAEDYPFAVLCDYAAVNAALIKRLTLTGVSPVRALTMWSEEIEYSTENVGLLLEALNRN